MARRRLLLASAAAGLCAAASARPLGRDRRARPKQNNPGGACNVTSYVVYTDVDWAPFEGWDPNTGRPAGFHKELTDLICSTTAFRGVECDMVRDNWQSIWYEKKCNRTLGACSHYPGPGILDDYYDAVIMQINPERWSAYDYSNVVAGSSNVVAVARKAHSHNHDSFPADGDGETFLLIEGYADNTKIMAEFPKATIVNVDDGDEQLDMLLGAEPTDSIVLWKNAHDAAELVAEHNKKYRNTERELKVIGHPTFATDGWNLNEKHGTMAGGVEGQVALAFNKNSQGSCKRQLVNQALLELSNNGLGRKLCEKHPMIRCIFASTTFSVSSPSFADMGRLPDRYAVCKTETNYLPMAEENMNPGLTWQNAPPGTKSFAVIAKDLDRLQSDVGTPQEDSPRETFYHWILFDIPADQSEVRAGAHSDVFVRGGKAPGAAPANFPSVQATNDWTDKFDSSNRLSGVYGGYDGPCANREDPKAHRLQFTVYALSTEALGVSPARRGVQVEAEMRPHVLASASITAQHTTNPQINGKGGCNVKSYVAYSDVDWAPYEGWNASTGQMVGFHKDLTDGMCRTKAFAGVRCEMVRDNWQNIWYESKCDKSQGSCSHYPGEGVLDGWYDSVFMQVNPERTAAYDYSWPILNSTNLIAIAKVGRASPSIPADGSGVTFFLIEGWADNVKIMKEFPNATAVNVANGDEQIDHLLAAAPDANAVFWRNIYDAARLVQEHNEDNQGTPDQLKLVGHPTATDDGWNLNEKHGTMVGGVEGTVALAFKKDWEGNCKRDLVHTALVEMMASGALGDICRKHPMLACTVVGPTVHPLSVDGPPSTPAPTPAPPALPAPEYEECDVKSFVAYTDVDWAPYEGWNTSTGQAVGFHKELLDLMCATEAFARVRCEMVRDTWQNIWYETPCNRSKGTCAHYPGPGILANYYDTSIMQVIPERASAYDYSDIVADSLNLVAIVRKEHMHGHHNFPPDGAGHVFLLIEGYADNAKIIKEFPKAEIRNVADGDAQEAGLLAQNATGMIVIWKNVHDARALVLKYEGTDTELKMIGHPTDPDEGFDLNGKHGTMAGGVEGQVAFAFKKDRDGQCKRHMVNKALSELRDERGRALCNRHPLVKCIFNESTNVPTFGRTADPPKCKVSSYVAYTDVDWLPFEAWNSSSGQAVGFHKDLTDAMCATPAFAGVECDMVRDNWQSIWYESKCDRSQGTCNHYPGEGIQGGFYDAVIMQINPERWSAYLYGDVVADSTNVVAIARNTHGHNKDSFPADGAGETFILIEGYADNAKIIKEFPNAAIVNEEDGAQQLARLMQYPPDANVVIWQNKHDAAETVRTHNAKFEGTDDELKIIGHPNDNLEGWDLNGKHGTMAGGVEGQVALAFKKDFDGNCKREMVNKALQQLKDSGKGAEICGKYPLISCIFNTSSPPAPTAPSTFEVVQSPCAGLKSYVAYTDVDWTPFEGWNEETGQAMGFHRDLTDAMCATTAFHGVECGMVRDAWQRIWYEKPCNRSHGECSHYPGPGIQSDYYDAVIMQVNPERWASYDYAMVVAGSTNVVAVARKDHRHSSRTFPYNGAGETFVLIEGYADNVKIMAEFPEAEIINVDDGSAQLDALMDAEPGESIVIWKNRHDAAKLVADHNKDNAGTERELKIIGHQDNEEAGWDLNGKHGTMPGGVEGQVALAFKKDKVGSCKREMVNKALDELAASGQGARICAQYPLIDCRFAKTETLPTGGAGDPSTCAVTSYTAYTDVDWAPFEAWDPATGTPTGFHKELTDAMCATDAFRGVKCNIVRDNWANIWYEKPCDRSKGTCSHYPGPGILSGYYDACIMQVNSERWASYDYGDVVADSTNVIAVVKVGHGHNHLSFPVDGAGETFILIEGYADNAKIIKEFPAARIQNVPDGDGQLRELLAAGPTDSVVVWMNVHDAAELVAQHNQENRGTPNELRLLGHPQDRDEGWDLNGKHGTMAGGVEGRVAMAFSKDREGSCVRQMVNRALQQLRQSGTASQICAKYPMIKCIFNTTGSEVPSPAPAPVPEIEWCSVTSYTAYTDVDWAPFEGWNESTGRMVGFHKALTDAICKTQTFDGVECGMVRDNWQSIWYEKPCNRTAGPCTHYPGPGIQGEYYDSVFMQVNPERWISYDYTISIAESTNVVAVAKVGHRHNTGSFPPDGSGETFLLIDGYADNVKIIKEFPKAGIINVVDQDAQLAELLAAAPGASIVMWLNVHNAKELIQSWNKENKGTPSELKFIGHEGEGQDGWDLNGKHGTMAGGVEGQVALAFKRDREGSCKKAMVERALAELRSNGGAELCAQFPLVKCAFMNNPTAPPPELPEADTSCRVDSYVAYTDVDWQPFEGWNDTQGVATGFHKDLTDAMCETEAFRGVKQCELLRDNWQNIWYEKPCNRSNGPCSHYPGPGIQSDYYDAVIMQINPERWATYDYSNPVADRTNVLAVAKVGHRHNAQSFPSDGSGETFVLIDGYADNAKVMKEFPKAEIITVADGDEQIATLLAADPTDSVVIWMNVHDAADLVSEHNAKNSGSERLKIIGHPTAATDGWNLNEKHQSMPGNVEGKVALAFKRDKNGRCKRDMVNRAMQELKESGVGQQICVRHRLVDCLFVEVQDETTAPAVETPVPPGETAFPTIRLTRAPTDWDVAPATPVPGQEGECAVDSYVAYTDVDWEPFEGWDGSTGQFVGFHKELTDAMCATNAFKNVKCKMVRDKWSNIWYEQSCERYEGGPCNHYPGPGILDSYYDSVFMQINPERLATYDYTDPIADRIHVIAIARAAHRHSHVTFPADGAGETFVLIKGYADNEKIMRQFPKANFTQVTDADAQFSMLTTAPADASIVIWRNVHDARELLIEWNKIWEGTGLELKFIGHPTDSTSGWNLNQLHASVRYEGMAALAFRKDAAGSCRRRLVNSALDELRRSGAGARLCSKFPLVGCLFTQGSRGVPAAPATHDGRCPKPTSYVAYSDVDWGPFEGWDQDTGNMTGFHKELLDLMCATDAFAGVTCGMVRDAWQSIWYEDKCVPAANETCNHYPGPGIQADYYDATIMQINPERWASYEYSIVIADSTNVTAVTLAFHRHNRLTFPRDGSGETFVMIDGYADTIKVKKEFPNATYIAVGSADEQVTWLMRMNATFNVVAWMNVVDAERLVRTHNAMWKDTAVELKIIGHPAGSTGWNLNGKHGTMAGGVEGQVALGFKKSWAGTCKREMANRALAELRGNGKGAALCARHPGISCLFTAAGSTTPGGSPAAVKDVTPACRVSSYTAYTDVDWEPFEAWNRSTGELVGFHRDLTVAMCATEAFRNVACDMVRDKWSNIWYESECSRAAGNCSHYPGPGIQSGYYDSVIMQINPERWAAYDYSVVIAGSTNVVAIATVAHRHTQDTFPADGDGETFLLIQGYADNTKIQSEFPKATIRYVASQDAQVSALVKAGANAVMWSNIHDARVLVENHNSKWAGTASELKLIGHPTALHDGWDLNGKHGTMAGGVEGKVALAFKKTEDGACKRDMANRALAELAGSAAARALCAKHPMITCEFVNMTAAPPSSAPAPQPVSGDDYCADVKSITAFTDVYWNPFEGWDENTGEPRGFHADLWRAMCGSDSFKAQGVECDIVRDNINAVWYQELCSPFSGGVCNHYPGAGLQGGFYDAALLQITAERNVAFEFSNVVAARVASVAIAQEGHRHNYLTFPPDGAGETFILVDGYADNANILREFPKADIVLAIDPQQQYDALVNARDGARVVMWRNVHDAAILVPQHNTVSYGKGIPKLRIMGHPVEGVQGWNIWNKHETMGDREGQIALAFKKDRAGKCRRDLVNRALEELRETGKGMQLCGQHPLVRCLFDHNTPAPTPLPPGATPVPWNATPSPRNATPTPQPPPDSTPRPMYRVTPAPTLERLTVEKKTGTAPAVVAVLAIAMLIVGLGMGALCMHFMRRQPQLKAPGGMPGTELSSRPAGLPAGMPSAAQAPATLSAPSLGAPPPGPQPRLADTEPPPAQGDAGDV